MYGPVDYVCAVYVYCYTVYIHFYTIYLCIFKAMKYNRLTTIVFGTVHSNMNVAVFLH